MTARLINADRLIQIINAFALILCFLFMLVPTASAVAPKNMQICYAENRNSAKYVEIGEHCPPGMIAGETTAYWDAINAKRLRTEKRESGERFIESAMSGGLLGGAFGLLLGA